MGACGTSRNRGNIRPLGAILHGYVARGQVDYERGDEERGNFLVSAVLEREMVFLDCGQSAETGADQNTDSLGILLGHRETGILHCKLSSRQRILDEEVHLFNFFFIDEILRVEVLDFTGYFDRKIGDVKAGYRPD